MSVSNLFELIEAGFEPHAVEDHKVVFQTTDDVDRDVVDFDELGVDGGTLVVNCDEINDELLRKADNLLVWLHRTYDATDDHIERFRTLRAMLVEEYTAGWTVPADAAAQLGITDIDAAIDRNVARIQEAFGFSVTMTQDPASTLVVIDGTPIGLVSYFNLEVAAERDTPRATFSFCYTQMRDNQYRIINRGVKLHTATMSGDLERKGTYIEGTFLPGAELRGFDPDDEGEVDGRVEDGSTNGSEEPAN